MTFASIEEGENATRRRDGLPELRFEWDAVGAIIARFDAGRQSDLANVVYARSWRLHDQTTYRQDYTAMISQAGELLRPVDLVRRLH